MLHEQASNSFSSVAFVYHQSADYDKCTRLHMLSDQSVEPSYWTTIELSDEELLILAGKNATQRRCNDERVSIVPELCRQSCDLVRVRHQCRAHRRFDTALIFFGSHVCVEPGVTRPTRA